ncbi:MAG: alanine racemase [Crocinitomicaceae bacterium]
MNLDYSYSEISQVLSDLKSSDSALISSVAFDTRKLINGEHTLFFAMTGVFRDGHEFIESAYNKGVRHFIVSTAGITAPFTGAKEIVVKDTLSALLDLAKHHRNRFNFPIVAITGSNGKTTTKEWLSQFLGVQFQVSRSPKSYNSQLGVALSILEFNSKTDIGIIEVGVSTKKSMIKIRGILKPTHGIITSFGSAHRELFDSEAEHLSTKLALFDGVKNIFYPESLKLSKGILVSNNSNAEIINQLQLAGDFNRMNAQLAITVALFLGVNSSKIKEVIPSISPLALRLETFPGNNNNTILNDTYSLDIESLRNSLEYQLATAKGKKRYAIIGVSGTDQQRKYEVLLNEFKLDGYFFYYKEVENDYQFQDSNILIKGNRELKMELLANTFKEKNHQTYLEIDIKAIRHNINYTKSVLNAETKLLCIVKASSYGSDSKTMSRFLEEMGVDYLGVAYVDEGIELRKNGVSTPILVMNAEESTFGDCVKYRLEPAVFSLKQLQSLIRELILQEHSNFPIHIKIETGMNRLGFTKSDIKALIDLIKTQPEVVIKSIYSHLAESELALSEFTRKQIALFEKISTEISSNFSYQIDRHILNSEGIHNYTESQFDMVRLGIGMYGVNGNKNLRPAVSWLSAISQLKEIHPYDYVGYSRGFIAEKKMEIAIIPVGYADGFKRTLGQGNGGVFIQNHYCPTVGNVCMDMIMVNVTNLQLEEGERVEIIGEHQTILDFAQKAKTISYEVMTSFSQRVHRVYIGQ